MKFRFIALIIIASVVCGIQTAGASCLNLSPLVFYESGEEDYLFKAAGPFFEFSPDRAAVRPVFHTGGLRTDILFPLGLNTENRGLFFPVYSSRIEENHVRRTLFPFFCGRYQDRNYGGIFPVYGMLYHRFGYDKSCFLLWPIYSSTIYNNIKTYHLLWPVFSYSYNRSFKMFPIYGYKKTLDFRHDFWLWPIFHRMRGTKNMDAALPFFQHSYGETFENISILWPFFSLSRDYLAHHTSIDAPWPLIRFAKGGYKETKIFPFYHNKIIPGMYSLKTVLWPVYRNEINYDKHGYLRRDKTNILILCKFAHILNNEGEESTETTIWPLWHHSKSSSGFCWYFPWILPFINEGYQNNWLPVLTLAHAQGQNKSSIVDVLWHTFFYKNDGTSSRFSFSFLCSFETGPDTRQLGFLFDRIKVNLP